MIPYVLQGQIVVVGRSACSGISTGGVGGFGRPVEPVGGGRVLDEVDARPIPGQGGRPRSQRAAAFPGAPAVAVPLARFPKRHGVSRRGGKIHESSNPAPLK